MFENLCHLLLLYSPKTIDYISDKQVNFFEVTILITIMWCYALHFPIYIPSIVEKVWSFLDITVWSRIYAYVIQTMIAWLQSFYLSNSFVDFCRFPWRVGENFTLLLNNITLLKCVPRSPEIKCTLSVPL